MDNNSSRSKKITLKDIAKATGFTVNTVSRALNDKEDISDATKKLIRETANSIGYIGNLAAGSLRTGSTKTIAIILGDISNPVFAILVKEMEKILRDNGYSALILNTDETYILEERAIISALSKNVDGIIICPTQKDDKDLKMLADNEIPFVLFGRRFDNSEYNYVIADDKKGGYLATKHLIDKGHKRILSLIGPQYVSSSRERLDGYRKALIESNIEPEVELVREISITTGSCNEVLKRIIKENIKFTAISVFSDLLAWEAIYTLNELGFRVPEDIAVVGFDNIQEHIFSPLMLTSVNSSKSEMARKTVTALLNIINNNYDSNVYKEVIDVELIVRKTS